MDLLGPFYRDVGGFTGYRVGLDGSVWTAHVPGSRFGSLGDWRPMKPLPNGEGGHFFVRLAKDGRSLKRYIHRLVLETFVGPCPPGMEALHDDGDPSNNRLSNLLWGTRKQNCADTARHGRAHRGERHYTAKLKVSDLDLVAEIRREIPVATFVDLGIFFGVSEATIRAAVRGRNWAWVKREAS